MSYSDYFEFVISQIDNGYYKLSDFDDETLFMNIYIFWCFTQYLSPYYKWGNKALRRLEVNIRRKWNNKDLTNVNLFIDLVKKHSQEIDPSTYFFNSENYLTKLMFLKPIMDVMWDSQKKKMKKKNSILKIRKPIR